MAYISTWTSLERKPRVWYEVNLQRTEDLSRSTMILPVNMCRHDEGVIPAHSCTRRDLLELEQFTVFIMSAQNG